MQIRPIANSYSHHNIGVNNQRNMKSKVSFGEYESRVTPCYEILEEVKKDIAKNEITGYTIVNLARLCSYYNSILSSHDSDLHSIRHRSGMAY